MLNLLSIGIVSVILLFFFLSYLMLKDLYVTDDVG